ncbi:MAG: hypothetical protein QNK03_06180 [Myxococcota bacterium]|nr:hypothetical protein [Myxococcota bacterium]
MNQLLKSQIESGLLQLDIDQIDLTGGGSLIPVMAGVLAGFVPGVLDQYNRVRDRKGGCGLPFTTVGLRREAAP